MGNKSWLMLLCSAFMSMEIGSQEIPFVYEVENTEPDVSPLLPGIVRISRTGVGVGRKSAGR